MKKILILLMLTPFVLQAQNYQSQNISLLGNWNNPTQPAEPVYGIKYQGVCGWKDTTTNREYAIIGTSTGTQFVDVTNPTALVACDYIPATHGNLIWHEIKTWHQYCYIVSDDNAPNSFIIADMSYLPDSVHVVRNDNTLFEKCHTIFIDGDKLYGGSVTLSNNTYYPMAVYDLSINPINPPLLRTIDQDYPSVQQVHDMFVRNDTVYASCGFGGLGIYKFNSTTNQQFTQLAVLTNYPESGYNHSSFLSSDGRTLIFMDEVPVGMGIKSLDVSNMGNVTMNQIFRSHTGNTPHNPYILGNDFLIAANYTDGIQLYNISNPSNCVLAGYFDTDTLINFPNYTQAYHGCWGADPFLPSGILLAADMQNGLYTLDISAAIASTNEQLFDINNFVDAYPNPFNTNFCLSINLTTAQTIQYSIFDNAGRLVIQNKSQMPNGKAILEVPAEELLPGIYTLKVEGQTFSGNCKLAKTK
ncbi:MAG: choice-of-anchor B family protein [Bacteroidetes bacterium]|nr:choice-of-anchor B family protein [Bacteroidota bacterium]PHX83299.1 MAG: hypothetical protein CK539_00025 [Flavobacteriales bacterium]